MLARYFSAFRALETFIELRSRMRWKLLLIASLLAALAGAGLSLGILALLQNYTSLAGGSPSNITRTTSLLIPLPAIVTASIFVYRHTAKRRGLQATTVCFFTTLLTVAALIIGFKFLVRF